MAIAPITPEEAKNSEKHNIPDYVVEAVNELLETKFNRAAKEVTLKQKEIVNLAIKIAKEKRGIHVTSSDLFEKNHMDIEELYMSSGWIVLYDKPGYNESYDANFTFKPCVTPQYK